MRRFASFVSGASHISATVHRRTVVIRAQPIIAGAHKAQTWILPTTSLLNCTRSYSDRGGAPHGGYPPPPPPMYPPQYQVPPGVAAPMDYRPYYYPMAPPPQQGPDLGTPSRPMVVVAAPAPRSWASRIWLMLFLVIGVSAAINIYEEFEARTSDASGMPSKGAGRGGLANMFNVQEVKPVDLESSEVSFDSVRGCDEAKEELEEIVQFLKDPKKFIALGGRLPKGALLVGPPGCGKTMLAKAIAKEAGVKFYYAAGSEFDEMFVGVGARRVRELFAAAKQNGPALIFIDEIDALGGKRSKSDHAYSRMTLNQLLAEMDGFQSSDEVIVIAATNTPDALDKALTRPGRFDTTVSIDPPDLNGRSDIAELYLSKVKHDATVKPMDIARGTTGFTGAELSNLINVAAIRAAVLDKVAVTSDEIEYAKDRVMMGAENRSKNVPESEKRITAYHEGGHALVAILLENEGCDPVHKATIVPRGSGIMGLVQQQPTSDKYSQTKKQCISRIKVCLAGRVAEELLLGQEDVTTGAASDFQQATQMARNMIRRFGFSGELGTVDYESADTHEGAYMSDSTKLRIENEIQSIVREAYETTRQMLNANRPKLDSLAQQLLRHETLSGDEIKRILKGEVIEEKIRAVKATKKNATTPPPSPRGGLKVPVEVVKDKTKATA
ncbi:mitochondrial ATP-dependent zinc metallopeptidase, putative [Bodo saltans]|uniref:Mitochondrial ATP-dependent zinc metallopeptidase, putative n=1 Tax=Bodo saltans TaxID=75058 RepID=A0A0S4J9Q2_BODSA|nr:mitochondrial ATP-dependent zinc metallopeptidase, putative [Bodo saltans]|eukprot:CUG87089.1 mitochondrial ATP-dependent zinc metallopeptidase, putative [Bodo saltans]